MKYLLTLIVASSALFFNSCKKEKANTTNTTTIAGTWELEKIQNGLQPEMDYPNGNGNTIMFTQDSLFSKYTDGNLSGSGTYSIVADATAEAATGIAVSAGEFMNRIIFSNDTTNRKIFFQLTNTKLTFISGYFPTDGGSTIVYGRK